jgi:hypothetical protein
MSTIKKFIHSLTQQELRVLGRWKTENCMKKINFKVDLANEDHCGTCSQYSSKKWNKKKEQYNTNTTSLNEYEEYIRFMM